MSNFSVILLMGFYVSSDQCLWLNPFVVSSESSQVLTHNFTGYLTISLWGILQILKIRVKTISVWIARVADPLTHPVINTFSATHSLTWTQFVQTLTRPDLNTAHNIRPLGSQQFLWLWCFYKRFLWENEKPSLKRVERELKMNDF